MIKIEKPRVLTSNNKVLVKCKILIDDVEKELFYEIGEEYKDYLCVERSDAFVVAALYYALTFHHDIYCGLPMTSELFHNLTTFLIPTLVKNSNRFKNIKLNVPITYEKLETYGAVGTGLSCGIDSFHVVKNYLNPEIEDMKLTCFCLNNVGSFKAYNKIYRGIGADKAREEITANSIRVAKDLGLPIIITNSNLSKVFPDVYYRVHTFSNMFSVLLMQKYFGKYYYASSGYDLSHYNVVDSYDLDSAEYEILIFYCLSTSTLKIYPEGNEKTRLEKTISIANFKPAQKYLHVCIKDSKNCGKCLKCRRTLLMLDAIGELDKFRDVFDIKYYKKHKDEYIKWLKKEEEDNHEMNVITAKLLKQKNGGTEYKNIDFYNKNNILIPELDINNILIFKDKILLEKSNKISYDSRLVFVLSLCIEIAKCKNKKISIPKFYLENVKETLKSKNTIRKKLGYIKRVILKKKTRIYLYELIYFILYKPDTFNNISKFLVKNKIVGNVKLNNRNINLCDFITTYKEFLEYEVLKDALLVGEKEIKGICLKNDNVFLSCKDRYYKNICKDTFIYRVNNEYYLLGMIGDYFILVNNDNNGAKKQILDEAVDVYGLVNML